MSNTAIETQIIQELAGLPPADRRKVLEFARSLSVQNGQGEPGAALMTQVGVIPPEDLREMAAAIQEHCEQVDGGGW